MMWDAVDNALQFLPVVKHGIVLQCPKTADIPYVKRHVRECLGTPNREMMEAMFYGDKYIKFRSMSSWHEGCSDFREEQLFYIPWERDRDIPELENMGIDICTEPERPIALWKSIGMSVSQIYNALLSDGYDKWMAGMLVRVYYDCTPQ